MSTIQQNLETLCKSVEDTKVQGCFLLSSAEVSNYWIPIDRLRTHQTINAVEQILRICLPRFQLYTKAETIFAPRLTTTTSDTFPLDVVVNQILDDPITTSKKQLKKQLNLVSINFDQYGGVVNIPEGSPSGTWLGIFAMSTHINLITTVLEELHRRERIVENVLVLVERDKATSQFLLQQGVNLIPLVICDENTGKPTSILDMKQQPYTDYHKYFVERS